MNLLQYPRRVFAGIFMLALAVRLLHVLQMSASPLFADPAVDASSYAEHAARLAEGNWLGRGEGPFWQPPLYPYVLGLVKVVFPETFFYAARLLQALVGSLSCALIYGLGLRAFNGRVGAVAGLAAALYGPLIYFDARLLPTGLATLFLLVTLVLLLRAVERPSRAIFAVAGVVLGMTALTVATALALVPLLVFWLCWQFRNRDGWGWHWIGCFVLGTLVAVAPVSLRNATIGGDAVLISYNGGVNFYVGNNADYEKTISVRPGWEWEELVALPLREGLVQPSDKSRYFYARAFESIAQAPLEYGALLVRKTAQFWHGDEIERNQEIYYWRKYSAVLATSLWKWGLAFPFGLVTPLALIGLAVYVRQRGLALPVLFALGYGAAVIAFFVTSRYRMPVIPLLLLFAVYGAFGLYEEHGRKTLRQNMPSVALLGGLLLVCNMGLSPMDMSGSAATQNDLGNAYLRQGRYDMAQLKFEQAVRRDSTYWQAWFNLGGLRALHGDLQGALSIFQRVAAFNPERADVWSNLAGAHVGLGEYGKAAQVLEEALRVAPPRPDIYVELIRLYMAQRASGRADSLYHRALSQFPDDPYLHTLHDEIAH